MAQTPVACGLLLVMDIQACHLLARRLIGAPISSVMTSINPFAALAAIIVGTGTIFYLKYRRAIKRRIKQVEEESWVFGMGVTMERSTAKEQNPSSSAVFQNLRLLELSPSFRKKYGIQCSLVSLGEYLSSLRPAPLPKPIPQHDIPQIIHREIEAGMAAALLKVLGPSIGRALLPAIGLGPAQSMASGIATRWFVSNEGASISYSDDRGGLPVSLMTLLSMSDTNAKLRGGRSSPTNEETFVPAGSAMDKMLLGEIGFTPSFCDPSLVSNLFVLSRDFPTAIKRMEDRMRHASGCGQSTRELDVAREDLLEDELLQQDMEDEAKQAPRRLKDKYDPHSRKMSDPVPINPRLFPGLHLGMGDAQSTHTNREVLKNRLMSILLNRLGANYTKQIRGQTDLFTVQLDNEKLITTPWELVQVLIDSGHKVEAVPTCQITTFGISLSILEDDDSWSYIPLAAFLESGYEDADGMMAPAFMPHSGLNVEIRGPLFGNRVDGTPSKCSIQHYISIDGYCGWQSNHNGDVPWLQAVKCGTPVTGKEAVRATRLAGLHANVLNGIATDMALPFGGYGLTGVCNDTAAVTEQCLYGTSSVYPMSSIGRFMQLTLRYAQRFRNKLQELPNMKMEVDDLCALIKAMRKIPSDINASPTNASNAAKRMLHCLPQDRPFMLMDDTKKVMESILREEEAEDAVVETNEVLAALAFTQRVGS